MVGICGQVVERLQRQLSVHQEWVFLQQDQQEEHHQALHIMV